MGISLLKDYGLAIFFKSQTIPNVKYMGSLHFYLSVWNRKVCFSDLDSFEAFSRRYDLMIYIIFRCHQMYSRTETLNLGYAE